MKKFQIAFLQLILFLFLSSALNLYALTPAYMSNSDEHDNYGYTMDDLKESDATFLSEEILQKVEELQYDPVKIYEYVHNNIDFIPYYGSKLGALGTLYEKKANSFDQASLLISMYRSLGIPCRYVAGYILMRRDVATNWVSAETETGAETIFRTLLRTSGIDLKSQSDNDSVDNPDEYFRFFHVWVEAYLPYGGTRGTPIVDREFDNDGVFEKWVIEKGEKMWIPLDPSFKRYENKFPVRLTRDMPFDALDFLNQYINSPVEKMPDLLYIENLQNFLEERYPEYSLEDLTYERSIIKEKFDYLPATLPDEITVSRIRFEESLLDEYKDNNDKVFQWQCKLEVKKNNNDQLLKDNEGEARAFFYPLSRLFNKRITLTFQVDERTRTYSGDTFFDKLTSSPKLLPILKIDGEIQNYIDNAESLGPLVANRYPDIVKLWISYSRPGPWETQFWEELNVVTIDIGSYVSVFLNFNNMEESRLDYTFQKLKECEKLIDIGEADNGSEAPLGQNLYTFGAQYFYNNISSIKEISSLTNCFYYYRLGVAVVFQPVVYDSDESSWVGSIYKLDVNNNVFVSSLKYDTRSQGICHQLVGMVGSAHEHKVFEDMLNVKATSTMRFLRMAKEADDNDVVFIDQDAYESCNSNYTTLKTTYDMEYDVDFLEDHIKFDEGNENALYILPTRMATEQEAGYAKGTGFIKIRGTSLTFSITNDTGKVYNGGLLSTRINPVSTTFTAGLGFWGFPPPISFPPIANHFNTLMSGNSISLYLEGLNSSPYYLPPQGSTVLVLNEPSVFVPYIGQPIFEAYDVFGTAYLAHMLSPSQSNFKSSIVSIEIQNNLQNNVIPDNVEESLNIINRNGNFVPQFVYDEAVISDPIDVRTGEFYVEDTDVDIPGRLPIIIKRNYSSQQESFDLMGYGWHLNLNYFLWANEAGLLLANELDNDTPSCESVVLRLAEENVSVIEYNLFENDGEQIVFKPFPETNPEIVNTSDEGLGSSSAALGNKIIYDISEKEFTFVSHNGTKKYFKYKKYEKGDEVVKERLYLQKIEDINGNYLNFTYYEDDSYSGYGLPKQIENKSGSYVDFRYDSKGRVSSIISSDNREISYFYGDIIKCCGLGRK